MRKLATHDIETAVEALLEELDDRSPDPDLEADWDSEADSDEESCAL